MADAAWIKANYPGYAGWNDTAAIEADFAATGGSGKENGGGGGGGASPEDLQKALEEANRKEIERETAWLKKHVEANPFIFDEQYAKEGAQAEYEPYYTRMLNDYLEDVQVKRETVQSDITYLKSLREYDLGKKSREYTQAVRSAEEGYAGKGLYSSGFRRRDVGEKTVEYGEEVGAREEFYEHGQAGYQRQLGEYQTGEERQRRDIFGGNVALGGFAGVPPEEEGLYQTAMEGGIEQRRGEDLVSHYSPIEQAYYRAFPSAKTNLKGYMPTEYYQALY